MQISAGRLYRFKKAPCRVIETDDMYRKAHIEIGKRKIWVASSSLSDY